MINHQPTTWLAHLLITLGAAIAGYFFAPWGLNGQWGFVIGATLLTGFFVVKEAYDEMAHRLAKDYDKVDASGVTPRADKVGDLIGPVGVAATAWAITILELF